LTERNYAIVDELIRVAREVNSTPAAVALAWVQTRPGVTSTIIEPGASSIRTWAALDVTLDAAHVEALNLVSKPALNFPAGFLAFAPSFMQAWHDRQRRAVGSAAAHAEVGRGAVLKAGRVG
jgi:diketogulonate reductase-like aldo/keto reductase